MENKEVNKQNAGKDESLRIIGVIESKLRDVKFYVQENRSDLIETERVSLDNLFKKLSYELYNIQ